MVHLHDFLHRRQLGERLREEANNLLNGRPLRAKQDEGVATVFSVVYVTASASFTGPTAGFVTQTANNAPSTTKQTSNAQPTTSQSQNNRDQNSNNDNDNQTSSRASQRVSSATATESNTARQTAVVGTPVQASRSATSAVSASASTTPAQQISQDGGMSGGAKAGVAFGVLAAIALVAGIAFLIVRKKKQQKQEEQESHNLDNEKAGFGFAAVNHTPRNDNSNANNSRAPRLSLRPVTQFMGIGEPKVQEMTSATGGLNSFLPPPPQQQHKSSWEQPRTNVANDAANPFGSGAERIDNHAAERAAENAPIPVPAVAPVPAANPFADRPSTSRSISPVEDSPLHTAPSSPPKAEIGTAAAVAVGAAAAGALGSGSPPKGPNNVHRVQLDFKPSMEDEIELRAGDVVRILHEYDDGWALCSYMDRSKQGVAPRTCLSKLPLKPRPAGPPPGMRPLRPESPNMRNFSGPPAPGHRNMYPAPLSPSMPNMNMPRGGPNSPPQGNRARSHSQSQSMDNGNRGSPQMMQSAGFGASPVRDHRRSASMGQLGLSPNRVPVRKPVPGQAM
ncbi:Hypothetical protein D9617_13g099780 [Elsinoe fawcettii]|nr:Hypothetical protein D9617_13g099780 [Elsinoe fawcettii]